MTRREQTMTKWLVGLGVLFLVAVTAWSIYAQMYGGYTTGDINTVYGKRRSRARTSVNGTSVFAEMFRRRGSKVSTWTQLSPRLRRSNTIVWVPNSFELLSQDEIDYFNENWLGLRDGRERTLIYVARDFDAAMKYWESQVDQSTGDQFLKNRSELARVKSNHAYARSLTGKRMECDWFSIDNQQGFVKVVPDQGDWAGLLDENATNIDVAGILEWPTPSEYSARKYEVLLGSDETPLIVRISDEGNWPDAQVIVCLNGFSVLNLTLVNHEHRKIASQLIDQCNDPRMVTFLESDANGMRISDSDPFAYSGFDALTQWPINSPFMHLVVAGILFCAMVFPIFGRPRKLSSDTPSNFGKHIAAMGELLALTRDRESALSKIKQYRNLKIEPLTAEPAPSRQDSGNPFKVSEV